MYDVESDSMIYTYIKYIYFECCICPYLSCCCCYTARRTHNKTSRQEHEQKVHRQLFISIKNTESSHCVVTFSILLANVLSLKILRLLNTLVASAQVVQLLLLLLLYIFVIVDFIMVLCAARCTGSCCLQMTA